MLINGTSGNDTLAGTAGADSISGGSGNDTLSGVEGNDTLDGGADNDVLRGGPDQDSLTGGAGDDLLDGGTGRDTMAGGLGNDIYYVDNGADVIRELAGQGRDSVYSSVSFGLTAGAEVELLGTRNAAGTEALTLAGNELANSVIGNAGNNALYGNAGADYLVGVGGNDLLDGGIGADIMDGGLGNDRYYVDSAGDIVRELAGQGSDAVYSSVSFGLREGAEIETLGTRNAAGTEALTLAGNSDNNSVIGNAGNNALYGGGGADYLVGVAGNDLLDGGVGADIMDGGVGNDRYYVDSAGDTVREGVGGGSDVVYSSVSFGLREGAEVETLGTRNAAGTEALTLAGNSYNNSVIGNAGNNALYGGGGVDYLVGVAGNDLLDGGTGADIMDGGVGDDRYYVDSAGDIVRELTGQGRDAVYSSVSFTLRAGAEVEMLGTRNAAGTEAVTLAGNEFANSVIGNAGGNALYGNGGADYLVGVAGNDLLDGGAGADIMEGGVGNDRYYVDSSSDLVREKAGQGTDAVYTSASLTLRAGAEIETLATRNAAGTEALTLSGNEFANSVIGNAGQNALYGGGGADYLVGVAGDDLLDGGAGLDIMDGGLGDDRYRVDDGGDLVRELGGQGNDIVYASVDYTLREGVEVETLATGNAAGVQALRLTGNSLNNNLIGNAGNNILSGGDGADYLVGVDGNDQLDGGAGADIMDGGRGNDVYRADSDADQVRELAGEGNDTVYVWSSYTLAAAVEIEVLALIAPQSSGTVTLIGNAIANDISGNSGADILNGGGGADVLRGGLGDDRYLVDDARVGIIEIPGGGNDTVESSVTYQLADNVENLLLTGSAIINGTGNELDNVIAGNAANNVLDGKGGNDRLTGSGGADRFAFTTALNAATNVDAIVDFDPTVDKIALGGLSGEPFAALASGSLWHGAFLIGTAAYSDHHHIIYNSASGALLYDADGVGGAAAVQFASVTPGANITADSFIVSGPENRLPVISSGSTATIQENSPTSTIVYQASVSDPDGDDFVYQLGGADSGRFIIDNSGAVRLLSPADFEAAASYNFIVIASDSSGLWSTKEVSVQVTNVVEGITDQEPNNSSSSAQWVAREAMSVTDDANMPDPTLPSITITGSITSTSDKDFFSVYLNAGELLILDVDGTATLDSELHVFYGSETNEIAVNDDRVSFDPGSTAHAGVSHNMDSFIRVRAPGSGYYYFSVQSFTEDTGGTSTGDYQVQVQIGPVATPAQLNEENVEALLSGSPWTTSSVTYGFPTASGDYGAAGVDEIAGGFKPVTSAQQTAIIDVIGTIEQLIGLTFVNAGATGAAEIRYGLSGEPETAHAYYPGSGDGGDVWFNDVGYLNPTIGNYEWMTIIHETGHALGLKHGHEAPALSPDRDSIEYSVMTYRSYTGASTGEDGGFTNETWGYAQTMMMYDIAALQRMYGADFTYNSGDTVYSWNPTTGAFLVNGGTLWTPGGNRVLMTIWDGGGNDTYDLSNYSGAGGGAQIDLRPGEFSTLSPVQLANLGDGHIARGSVANALLYENDVRSLIENAIGTGDADRITGNDASNRLTGGAGPDTFYFHSVEQSSMLNPDTLTDYRPGLDFINLAPIDTEPATTVNDGFTWIGANAFGGHAGELRVQVEGSVSHVYGDINGDSLADLHIIVNAVGLGTIDFSF